jgi:drug/metabolite transporter (DMT)-like permease
LAKLVLEQFQTGIGNVVTGWALYAALISAAVAIIASQSAYGSGPIAITQPVIEMSGPTMSVILGITIFHERLNATTLAILGESFGVILTVLGIIILGTSKRIIASEKQSALLNSGDSEYAPH